MGNRGVAYIAYGFLVKTNASAARVPAFVFASSSNRRGTMDRASIARAREVFADAWERPAVDRPAYVASACSGDPVLRERVEALLLAASRLDEFLSTPTLDMPSPSYESSVGAKSADPETPGTRIGAYRIVERIGEGGFGCVYHAEQEEPVRRQVALKIIKLGMDTRQVMARFELERLTLAMMDHPGIARVIDAGATATGRPYFVMELVRGVPITAYCDDRQLDTRDRLKLFVEVCRAIQHAHQKGIIHRDIKPGNVLVTEVDGRPVPKVIDFGIAKAIDQRLAGQTTLTEARHFIGTPAYMSPDQACPGVDGVDTRTDIYSLGVLLYELLTGAPPFDPRELASKSLEEIQRIICEVDPPRPSTRLLTLGAAQAAIAQRRGTAPARLGRLMRKELDWVVMKCLEKDRQRRYASADALATDVRRHLHDEPINARPPSRVYKLRKFSRRNKGLIAACAAVLLALVLGLVGVTAGLVREQRERDRAEHLIVVLRQFLANIDPQSFDVSLLTMLHLARELDNDLVRMHPDVESVVRGLLGEIHSALGMYPEAKTQLMRALELRKSLDAHPLDVAQVHGQLADLLRASNDDPAAAQRHDAEAIRILKSLEVPLDERPEGIRLSIDLAQRERELASWPNDARLRAARGTLHARRGDFAKAEVDYTRVAGANPEDHWPLFYGAMLRLQQAKRADYLADCSRLLAQFGQTGEPWTAERVGKAFFVAPGHDRRQLQQARTLVDGIRMADVPRSGQPWMQAVQGMAAYRTGEPAAAVPLLESARDGFGDEQPSVRAMLEYFLAMAHADRGDLAAGSEAFERGELLVRAHVPASGDPDLSRGNRTWGVENWIACRAAQGEAATVLSFRCAAGVLSLWSAAMPATTRPSR